MGDSLPHERINNMPDICCVGFQEYTQSSQPFFGVGFCVPYLLFQPQPASWIWHEFLTKMQPFIDKIRSLVCDHTSCRLHEVYEVQSSASLNFSHANKCK